MSIRRTEELSKEVALPSMEEKKTELEFPEREFAITRAHADAQAVNDNARAAAQSIMLVNGAAATAALAFAASYDDLSKVQQIVLSLGLACYGAGVGLSAYNLRKLTGAAYYYMKAWEERARDHPEHSKKSFGDADKLKDEGDRFFTHGFRSFVLGSVLLAITLIFLPPDPREDQPTVRIVIERATRSATAVDRPEPD